jgi:hypothetical protein
MIVALILKKKNLIKLHEKTKKTMVEIWNQNNTQKRIPCPTLSCSIFVFLLI